MCDIVFIPSLYTQLQFTRVAPPVLNVKFLSFFTEMIILLHWDDTANFVTPFFTPQESITRFPDHLYTGVFTQRERERGGGGGRGILENIPTRWPSV